MSRVANELLKRQQEQRRRMQSHPVKSHKEVVWHFPEVDPGRSHDLSHYVDKVREECYEFERTNGVEKKLFEALDILHAAESVVRKLVEQYPALDLNTAINAVVAKNFVRGYYSPDKSR